MSVQKRATCCNAIARLQIESWKHLFTQPSASVYENDVWISQLRRQRVLVKRKYNTRSLPRIIMPRENAHRMSFDVEVGLDSTSTNLLRIFTYNKYKFRISAYFNEYKCSLSLNICIGC